MYPSVYVCVCECLEKHVVMYTLKTCCVNVACSVRSTLSGQLDSKSAIQVQSIYHLPVVATQVPTLDRVGSVPEA